MREFQQIKKGRANTITVIIPETIENIPKVKLFDNYEMDALLFNLHQELLRLSMKKNHSYEVGFFWNLINWDEVYKINGTENGVALSDNDDIRRWIKTAPMNSVVVMHNHPRNGLFSGADLKSFLTYQSIYAMTAVCNDGTIYMMKKTEKFDPVGLMMYYSIGIKEGKDMKNSFLPLGYVPQTEEQIAETERRENLYEYYGIPYGVFDGEEKVDSNEIEKDRTEAQILIMQGKEIPKDLEERLLRYKKEQV